MGAHRSIDLATWIHRAARSFAQRTAIAWEGGALHYAGLSRAIDARAAELAAAGVRPGDRVALLLGNGPAFVECYFAAVQCGAIAVPLNTRLVARELAGLLADAEPAVVIAETELSPVLGAGVVPAGCRVGLVERGGGAPALPPARSTGALPPPEGTVALHRPASILYTSGTTGRPKGTIRSQEAACFILPIRQATLGIGPDTVLLASTPMFHAAGHEFMMFQTLAAGGRVVTRARFDEDEIVDAVDRERVTHAFFVPTMAARLIPELERSGSRWSSLRLWASAAAPLPAPLRERIRAAVPDARLWNVYGVTEAGVVSYLRDDAIDRRPASCVGVPGPGAECRCVDPAGTPVAPGAVGEIVVRSPEAMSGYWRRPEETAAALRDGWVHSGDLGTIDEHGDLHIVGRLKDMIVTGGENVYAAEVEHVIGLVPGVREVAVIGEPDPLWGEAVVAVVAAEPGRGDVAGAVAAAARSQLAGFKRPKRVVVLDSLPKNGFGKIDKQALRRDRSGGAAPTTQDRG